jgi:hypothetical protein
MLPPLAKMIILTETFDCLCLPNFEISRPIKEKDLHLGAFAKLQKTTSSFVVSVCPSIRLSVRLSEGEKCRRENQNVFV